MLQWRGRDHDRKIKGQAEASGLLAETTQHRKGEIIWEDFLA